MQDKHRGDAENAKVRDVCGEDERAPKALWRARGRGERGEAAAVF
jgi:hypothetical protein